jgi:PAS domain S-box-containing protein
MKILHLEDNPPDAELVRAVLIAEFPAANLAWVSTREMFIAELDSPIEPDLIVSDFNLPGFTGLAALELVRQRRPTVPFVFHSGSIGEEQAIMAVRAGAYDYVLKDNMHRLPLVLRRAIEESGERRNREANERRIRQLADIIERAMEAIVATDLEGRVTVWNRGAANLFAVPAGEALGVPAEELFPASVRDKFQAARVAVRETGSWRGELAFTTRDGREIVIEAHVTAVLDDAGQPNARLIVARDVTETKKLEEQFLRMQRLESLGLLAAGIAHDLNNVLAPVLMAGPLLRRRVSNPADSHILDILETSAQRGAGLVRQILGFANGSGDRFRATQVKHLVSDIVQIARASFPKSIELAVRVEPNPWVVECDPTQLHQVLLNLAVNARDAMLPGQGTLTFEVANRELDAETAAKVGATRAGPHLMIRVADTGCGMSPEVVERIWEPFFTTKGNGQGTGLGLATVRGIVVRHGGCITLDTAPGRGTAFTVYIPATAAATVAKPEGGALAALRGNGELVLMVEDDEAVREAAVAMLQHHAYRTISCADGHDGLATFSQRSAEISMILTDMDMPRLDGRAFATAVRRLRPDVKILAMSGNGGSGGEGTEDAALFDGILAKPFTTEQLLRAVHRTLHGDHHDDLRPGTG